MAKRKWTFWQFRACEGKALEEYLEKMAAEGWRFMKIWSAGIFCFEKAEPAQMEFAAVILPGSSALASRKRKETVEFAGRCEEAGWTVRYQGSVWQIFSREKPDGVPVVGAKVPSIPIGEVSGASERCEGTGGDGDWNPESPLPLTPERILASGRAIELAPARWVSVVLMLGLTAGMVWQIWRDPGRMLADTEVLVSCFCLFLLSLYSVYELTAAVRWYRNAGRCLERTGRLPERTLCQVRKYRLVEGIYLTLCCVLLLGGISGRMRTYGVLRAVLILTICGGMMVWVQEHGSDDQRMNTITYFVGAIVLGTLAVMLLTGVWAGEAFRENDRYRRLTEFPAELEAYGYEPTEEWYRKSMRSWFGIYQREALETRSAVDRRSVTVEYYENRIPAVIRAEAESCSVSGVDFWALEETEKRELDGIAVTGYDYYYQTDGRKGERVPYKALYVFADENRLLVLDFNQRPEKEWIDALAEKFAGGGQEEL